MQNSDAKDKQVRPSAEQRLAALEGTVASLTETMEGLHKMLREQGDLINEYITKQLVASGSKADQGGGLSPEDALFTFVCRRKFDQVEKELGRLRQLLVGPDAIRRAS
jgi:hypothetical protein